jgi:hypothetical protein
LEPAWATQQNPTSKKKKKRLRFDPDLKAEPRKKGGRVSRTGKGEKYYMRKYTEAGNKKRESGLPGGVYSWAEVSFFLL